MRIFIGIVFFFAGLLAEANVIQSKIFINRGNYTAIDGKVFPMCSFNLDTTFSGTSSNIALDQNDSLILILVNNDSVSHQIEVQGQDLIWPVVAPGDSVTYRLSFDLMGCFRYSDVYQYPKYRHMGLGGMIHVGLPGQKRFLWNLHEFNDQWNTKLSNNTTPDWNTYSPNYFTINGRSNPDINTDSLARVKGKVGDSLFIFIANNGLSVHSIHFHGYHAELQFSNRDSFRKGWSKDTYAIYPGESVVLLVVPDKTGEYPVHDHNLVAVTAGGLYPNGMFTTLLIE